MLLVFTLILLLMLPLLLIAIHKKGGDSAALFGTNPIGGCRSIPYNLLYNAKGATRGHHPWQCQMVLILLLQVTIFRMGFPLLVPRLYI